MQDPRVCGAMAEPLDADDLPVPNAYLALQRVRTGRRRRSYIRISHGQWAPGSDEPAPPETLAELLLWCAPADAVLSHESALWWYGLPEGVPVGRGRVHVTLPLGSCLQRKEFRVHVARLPYGDLTRVRGLMITTPPRTFLDLATRGRERLIVIGDAMVRAGLTTVDELNVRIARASRMRGVCSAREIAPLLIAESHSPPESVLRLRLHDAGLPAPVPQCPVDLGGLVLHTDLGWPAARVGLEYEGRQHAEQGQFEHDIDRYSAMAAAGWLIIRASRADLRAGSGLLIDRVRAALARRGLVEARH